MEDSHLTRQLLESLSSGELIKLADSNGIDIPAGLERIFIIEELLENFIEKKSVTADVIETDKKILEAVALPKQYNISYINVIIRDPLWVYAFWEIKAHDRELHEKAGNFRGYCLRVVPINNTENAQKIKENFFFVTIVKDDEARYLGFTGRQEWERYLIQLSAIRGNQEIQLAVSEPFTLPVMYSGDSVRETAQNPLIGLSGTKDFKIIKSTDRQSRVRQ
jgi:hypothetical protein